MAVTALMYGNFLRHAMLKEIDLISDNIKIMLCTNLYTPNQDTHEYKDVHITNEAAGTGYIAGGVTLTNKTLTYNTSTNTISFDADDITWPSSTITAMYGILYDDTPISNKPLIGYINFGADQSSSNGNFVITWDSAGIFSVNTP